MTRTPPQTSRRDFLKTSATFASSLACTSPFAQETSAAEPVTRFFAIGDTHYFANEKSPTELTEASIANCQGLIDTLNALPGTAIPDSAGNGTVGPIQGVIHAGDIIDTGDKRGALQTRMQQREWDGFTADYGLTGTEGRLKFPVYEVHGNHDSPSGEGLAIDGLIERTKKRQVLALSQRVALLLGLRSTALYQPRDCRRPRHQSRTTSTIQSHGQPRIPHR